MNVTKLKLKTVLMATIIMAYEEADEVIPAHIQELAMELQNQLFDAEDAGQLEGSLMTDFHDLWAFLDE